MKSWIVVLLFLALTAIDGLSALNLDHSPDSSGGSGEKRSVNKDNDDLAPTNTDTQQENARDTEQNDNGDQNVEITREVNSVHEYRSQHEEESSFNEESSSSFVQGQEGLTSRQSESRSNRNSESNSAFNRDRQTEYETSRNSGTRKYRKSESASKDESEDFQETSGNSTYTKKRQSKPGNQDQSEEITRQVNSVHEYGSKHQQESSYNEESSSSLVQGQEGLTSRQSESRSNRNSESNSAFNRDQQTEYETSRNSGTRKYRKSETVSKDESEDFQETSGNSTYTKKRQSKPENQDQNEEITREVNTVHEYGSQHQEESSYNEESSSSFVQAQEDLTRSQSESRSNRNSESNSALKRDQQTEDETSRNSGTTINRKSESTSKDESEDIQETSGSSTYIKQEQSKQENQETSRISGTTIYRKSELASKDESEDIQETSGSSTYTQQEHSKQGNQGLLSKVESQDGTGQHSIKIIIGKKGFPIALQRGVRSNPNQVINGTHFARGTGNQGTNSGEYVSRVGSNQYISRVDEGLNEPLFINGTENQGPDPGKHANGIPVQETNSGHDITGDENQDVNSKYISQILTKVYELLKLKGENGYPGIVPSGYKTYPARYVTIPGNRRTDNGDHRIRYYDATGHYMGSPSSPVGITDDDDTSDEGAPSLAIPKGVAQGSKGYRPSYSSNGDFDTKPRYIPGTDGRSPTTIFGSGPGSFNGPVLLNDAGLVTTGGNKDKTTVIIQETFPSNKNNYESEPFDYYNDALGSIIYKDKNTDETETTYGSDDRLKKDGSSAIIDKAYTSITYGNGPLHNNNDGANTNSKGVLTDETTNEHESGHGKLDKTSEILEIVGIDGNPDDEITKSVDEKIHDASTTIKKVLDDKSDLTDNKNDGITEKSKSVVTGKTSVVQNTDNDRSVVVGDKSGHEGSDDDKIHEISRTENHNRDGTDDTKITQDLESKPVDDSGPKGSDGDKIDKISRIENEIIEMEQRWN